MIRLTVDVNGETIGEICVENRGVVGSSCRYEILDIRNLELYEDELHGIESVGEVVHDPIDGAVVLLRKVLDVIEEDHLAPP